MISITNTQLRLLYFDIIISKFAHKATLADVVEEFEALDRYVHVELLELAYYEAIDFLKEVERTNT